MLLSFCFGVERGDLGVLAARGLSDWRQSAENDVLGTSLDSDIGDRLATVVLDLIAVGAEGRHCHGEDGVRVGQSCFEGRTVEHITLDNFDLLLELLGLF